MLRNTVSVNKETLGPLGDLPRVEFLRRADMVFLQDSEQTTGHYQVVMRPQQLQPYFWSLSSRPRVLNLKMSLWSLKSAWSPGRYLIF